MRYAILCPGQGSQAVGMGKDLYDNFKTVQLAFEEASDVLNCDMTKLLFSDNEQLGQSHWTQPAVLLVSVVAASILEQEIGYKPLFGLGHSLGEISAVCISGALSLSNALRLVHDRGKLMQTAQNDVAAGMMVVMGVDDKTLDMFVADKQQEGKRVWVANYNTDGQVVLAGARADLQDLATQKDVIKAKRMLLLDMSVASHCPLLESIVNPFRLLMRDMFDSEFSFDVISNVSTDKYNTVPKAVELLGLQLVSPVCYKQCIKRYEEDIDIFIECGHGMVLKGLNARITSKPTCNISNSSTFKETLTHFKKGT